MKDIRWFIYLGIAALLAAMAFYSCSKNSSDPAIKSSIPAEVLDNICPTCKSYDFWLPEKTKIEKKEGKEGNQIILTAPAGYLYYGLANDSSLFVWDKKVPDGSTVTVTCVCTNGNSEDCNPVGHDGTINCVIRPGCITCERQEKVMDPTKQTGLEILSGGFVNPGLGVSFAQPDDELPYAFEALLQYPEIKLQLDEFMVQFYGDLSEMPVISTEGATATAPAGYRFVVLNVYGRALVTLIPETKGVSEVGGSNYTCPCNGTSGSCKVKSSFGYYYCVKPSANPCNQACNTMTVEDTQKNIVHSYNFYYF